MPKASGSNSGSRLSGDRMTVKAPDGTVWSETTYAGEFPAQRVTEYSGEEYKTDDEGNYVKEDGQYVKVSYTAVATGDVPVQSCRERQPALVQGRGGQNLRG